MLKDTAVQDLALHMLVRSKDVQITGLCMSHCSQLCSSAKITILVPELCSLAENAPTPAPSPMLVKQLQ